MNLEPGVELDAAVAKALGWDAKIHESHGARWCMLLGEKVPASCSPIFAPSTDANAAIEAADSVFNGGFNGYWSVRHDLTNRPTTGPVWLFVCTKGWEIEGQSFCHAICLAILKAKEKP